MKKNNITQFLQSVVAIPLFAIMPITGVTMSLPTAVLTSDNNVQIESSLITPEEEKIRQQHADAIDAFFAKRNSPLEGYGMKFVTEAEKNNLPWNLLAAISIIESNGGEQACKGATNSVLGYGSCKIDFKSIDESIETVSRIMGGDSKYYRKDMTLAQRLKRYNSVIPTYYQKVTKVMKMIEDMQK